MGNPLTVDYAPGTQIPLALFQGVPLNVIVGTAGGSVDASAVSYTPADPLDWPIPPPTTVQTALDLLANVNGTYGENVGALGPLTSITAVNLAAVQPQKSGIYLAWAQGQVTGSGVDGGSVLTTILVDAVGQGAGPAVGYAPGSFILTCPNFVLTAVNRALPHTWALRFDSTSPTTLSIAAQRAKLMLLEL
jgi:hypothetical protein